MSTNNYVTLWFFYACQREMIYRISIGRHLIAFDSSGNRIEFVATFSYFILYVAIFFRTQCRLRVGGIER